MSYENIPKNATETAVLVEVDKIVPVDVVTLPDIPAKSFYFEVAAGRVADKVPVHIIGRNPDVDSGSAFEDLWSGGGEYTGFNATVAESISVKSTSNLDTLAGIGANTILISGLDTNLVEQQEILELNGTTSVLTVNSYLRASLASVLSAGSSRENQGTITGVQSTTTANEFFIMDSGNNRTLQAVFTVPANTQFLATNYYATLAKKAVVSTEIKVLVRVLGGVFQTIDWFALNTDASSYIARQFSVPFTPVPAGSDIKFAADVDVNNTAVAGGFEGILETLPV